MYKLHILLLLALLFCASLTLIDETVAADPDPADDDPQFVYIYNKFSEAGRITIVPLKHDRAFLKGLDLRGASLRSRRSPFRVGEFSYCDLTDADLSETLFVNCSFKGAKLNNVNAEGAVFRDCDLSETTIEGAKGMVLTAEQLHSTKSYTRKDLSNVSIEISDRGEVDLSSFNLGSSEISFADKEQWMKTSFANAYFGELQTVLTYEQLKTTKDYRSMVLTGRVTQMDLHNADLANFNLTDLDLSGSDITGADLTNAVITGCSFGYFEDGEPGLGIRGLTVEQIRSTWNYKTGNMQGIVLPPEIQSQLDAEKEGASD